MAGTVIQEDLTIDGKLTTKEGTVSISGRVTGDVVATSIEILSPGKVQGELSANDVAISGSLAGSVKCKSLALEEKSDVKADVSAETMKMSSGAKIKGHIDAQGG